MNKPDTESMSDWEYYREEITGNGFDGKMTIIFHTVRKRGGRNIVRLQSEKQARLIAAAPELLEALESAATYLAELGVKMDKGSMIHTAIAKARGVKS